MNSDASQPAVVYFICVEGNRYVNVSSISQFNIRKFGDKFGNDWSVEVTVGETTWNLIDSSALEAVNTWKKAAGK